MRSERFELAKFGEVVSYSIGGGWGKDAAAPGIEPVRIVRGTDLAPLNEYRVHEIPARFEKSSAVGKRLLRPGDIILEISGGNPRTNQSTGRSLLVSPRHLQLLGDVIPASFCRLVRVREEVARPEFVAYYLRWLYISGEARRFENQSTGLSNFQFSYFSDEADIPLPPLADQDRVAGALGAIDAVVANERRLAMHLDATAETLFRHLFLTRGAPRAALAELAAIHKSPMQPSATPDELFDHFSMPAYDRGALPSIERGEEMQSGKTRLPSGDDVVLFSKLNPTRLRVWWPDVGELRPAVCSPEFVALRATAPVTTAFLYAALRHDGDFHAQVRAMATGTTTSRQRVKPGDLLKATVVSPRVDPLRDWNGAATALYRRCRFSAERIRRLEALRDGLLPRLVFGEMRISETGDGF
jgi:type I restriction enzyme S subunit